MFTSLGKVSLAILQGALSASPVAPDITRNGTVHELCIAQIYVEKGTTTITSVMITDTRNDAALCGGASPRDATVFNLSGKADKKQAFDFGDIKTTARATAPIGWLACDGSAVSRTVYADLFAAIGTQYGAGDGTTTFNIPNLKGRVPVGLDTAQTEFNAIGKSGGEKTHTLTIPEIPNHSHSYSFYAASSTRGLSPYDGSWNNVLGNYTSGSTGGGGAHNNLQPYLTVNKIIYTGV